MYDIDGHGIIIRLLVLKSDSRDVHNESTAASISQLGHVDAPLMSYTYTRIIYFTRTHI